MRILTTVWTIFGEKKSGDTEIARNGASILIHDICEYMGKKVESFLLQGSKSISDSEIGHIKIVGNEKYLPGERTADNINKWQAGLLKCFEDALNAIKPDFVFIHAPGEFSMNCILACQRNNQPFAFVSHLYIGSKYNVLGFIADKLMEEKIYGLSNVKHIFVGNCMRHRVLTDFPHISREDTKVIVNGTSMDEKKSSETIPIRKVKKKNLLCPASIQPRKNQMGLIEAYSQLPKEVQDNVGIIFCGRDSKKTPYLPTLEKRIKELGIEDGVKYAGSVPGESMGSLYKMVDGIVLPSLIEGVSLVALEALVFGKPVIMLSENETAGDVNSPDATVLVRENTSEAFVDGIVCWYEKKWDDQMIKNISKRFKIERVADEYIDCARKWSNSQWNS